MSTCLRCWSCCCSSIVHSKYSNSSTIPCTRDANRDAAYVPNGVINEHEVDLSHFTKPTEVLGIGGFGLVRKVVKITGNDSGVEYAMKTTTKASILARSTGLQAMTSELKSMILCEGCEYICQLHYAFQDHSHIYFVLDHAIGGDMRYNMRRSPGFRFREDLARIFIKQVLLALHHCHQRSILHRDIKPENVLLHSSGKVSLSDFGVAKVLPDVENCRSTSGTHGYMAPEVYAKEHTHGTAFDWFATGITLFEFITGRRPFEASKLQRYHLQLSPEENISESLPSSTVARNTPTVSCCGFTSEDNEDPLLLEDVRITSQASNECYDFLVRILRPNSKERLGAHGNFQSLMEHPWMNCTAASLHPYPLSMVFSHLPHFENAVKQLKQDRGSNCGLGQIFSKVNMSQGEAQAAIQQHLQPNSIPDDAQQLFKNFEYNIHCNEDTAICMRGTSGSTATYVSGYIPPSSSNQPLLTQLSSPRRSARQQGFLSHKSRRKDIQCERSDCLAI